MSLSRRQISSEVVNVGAGDAADATTYYYYDMRDFENSSIQLIKAGAGTSTVTVEGTSRDFKDTGDAETNGTFADLTNVAYGAASFTATGQGYDETGITGTCTFIRVKVVIASSSGTTAYSVYLNRVGW